MPASERTKSVVIAVAAVGFGGILLVASLASLLFGLALLLFVPGTGGLFFGGLGLAGLWFGSFFLLRVAMPFVRLIRSDES